MGPKLFVLDDQSGLLKPLDLESITLNDITPRERHVGWERMRDISPVRLLVNAQSRYLGNFHVLNENVGIHIPGGFAEITSKGFKWAKIEDPKLTVYNHHGDGAEYFGIQFDGKQTVAAYDFRHNRGGTKEDVNEISATPAPFNIVGTPHVMNTQPSQTLTSDTFGSSAVEGDLALRTMIRKVFETYSI